MVAGNGGSGWACVLLGQDWFRLAPVAVADRLCGGTAMVTEQLALSFAGLLRQLRTGAKLTQEELADLAGTTRATINRVLRDEQRRGNLELRRGRTIILNRDEITRRAQLR